MTAQLNEIMARERVADLLRAAERDRIARSAGAATTPRRRRHPPGNLVAPTRDAQDQRRAESPALTIYLSDPDTEIKRLARLDSARRPRGPHLVAAMDGTVLAALPLAGGPAIANPFAHTAELIALLELRVAQLNGGPPRRRYEGVVATLLRRRSRRSATTTAGAC